MSVPVAADARAPRIVAFRRDADGHWVAALDCGHERHVRHDPPWRNHPWVSSAAGREAALGKPLRCGRCDRGSS